MYETNKKTVPISGEVEFMRNYIALMKLRCNEKTEVKTTFDVEQDVEIAPLLFISLIENAFKHGVSSSRHSMIDIHLEQQNNSIIFTCDKASSLPATIQIIPRTMQTAAALASDWRTPVAVWI